jgi:hypothetical protein
VDHRRNFVCVLESSGATYFLEFKMRVTCNNGAMARSSAAPHSVGSHKRLFSRTSLIFLSTMLVLLCVCLIFSWTTRDAMANLPFLPKHGKVGLLFRGPKTLVDLRSWQTAEALAPLAVTAEEKEFAHEAERLADHEVDQAFASFAAGETVGATRQAGFGAGQEPDSRNCLFRQRAESVRAAGRQR